MTVLGNCSNCAYANLVTHNEYECRYMPPVPALPSPPYFRWPAMKGTDWCGQWVSVEDRECQLDTGSTDRG